MYFVRLLMLAVGLSMDAFAVSVCKGFAVGHPSRKNMLLCGVWFGGFQMLMPLIGFFLGSLFADFIQAIDHWIAFGLLGIIGINMIREATDSGETTRNENADFHVRAMFPLAVATSIDALAVGISLAMAGNVNIWIAVAMIGAVTFLFSVCGVLLGSRFGDRFGSRAEVAGGIILILLGTHILLEHLGILP